jgi:hypothetical protein
MGVVVGNTDGFAHVFSFYACYQLRGAACRAVDMVTRIVAVMVKVNTGFPKELPATVRSEGGEGICQ